MSPNARDDAGGQQETRGGATDPPPSPAPATSNRASVKHHVESMEPGSWLRRFGEVEIRKHR